MAKKSTSIDPQNIQLVLKYAIASRLLVLTLIVLWRSLLSPYDTSASINPSCLTSDFISDSQVLFPRVASALEESIVWDSVYFVRIAQCGYEYEQSYAFLPLLPVCISFLSRTVLAPFVPLIGQRAVLALSGYMLNNIAFVFAALYLYRLTVLILNNTELALRASILFCFNPASIFCSSIYSESLYALLSVGGLYSFMHGANNTAALCFALSGAARSNGVLNAGYFGFQMMHRAYYAIFLKKRAYVALQMIVSGALRCLCIFLPFLTFQAYGYYNICSVHPEDGMRPWCKARLPLLYSYIQSHYWGVGFLRYFQVKQLPNFVLAAPILSLAFWSIVHYVKLWPKAFFSLGLGSLSTNDELSASVFSLGPEKKTKTGDISEYDTSSGKQDALLTRLRKRSTRGGNTATRESEDKPSSRSDYLPVAVLPFILHLSFMVATAFLVMHVQVATRFFAASPPLYWFASYVMSTPTVGRRWGYTIWTYCASYIFLGSLLFSNFYPFT